MIGAEVMIGSSPMADGNTGSTSSWRHHIRLMEAHCDSKSKEKNNGG